MPQDAVSELLEELDNMKDKIERLKQDVMQHFRNGHKELSAKWVLCQLIELQQKDKQCSTG